MRCLTRVRPVTADSSWLPRSRRTRRSGFARPSVRCGSAATSIWRPGSRLRTAVGVPRPSPGTVPKASQPLQRSDRPAGRVAERANALYYACMTRVLLAEDDPAISEPLARALRREGYEVDVRADGRAALGPVAGEG